MLSKCDYDDDGVDKHREGLTTICEKNVKLMRDVEDEREIMTF